VTDPKAVVMYVPLVGLLTWAAVVDVRSRRIPNWLTLTLVLCGLVRPLVMPHCPITFVMALAGMGIAAGFGITKIVLAGSGAGDMKLLAGVGAWLGPWPTLLLIAVSAIVAMLIAIIQSASQRRFKTVARDALLLSADFVSRPRAGIVPSAATASTGGASDVSASNETAHPHERARTMPFAVAVLIATVCVLIYLALGGR